MEYLDSIEEWRTLTAIEYIFRDNVRDNIQRIMKLSALKWRQRAKIKWCKLGDENSHFFHVTWTINKRKNNIKVLINNGIEHFDGPSKLRIATEHFKDLYGTTTHWSPSIDLVELYPEEQNLHSLSADFTWEEVLNAVMQSLNNRSPGPDGFTNKFYKKFIQTLKPNLLQLFKDFQTTDLDLTGVNISYITLIPKIETPTDIKDFRPISLLHSMPKLISKVLALRLKPKVSDLIDQMQSGFINKRSITENFILASELVQCALKRKKTNDNTQTGLPQSV